MNALTIVAICAIVFAYIECAIGTGYYMYLITSRTTQDKEEKKQIKKFSIAAGILFPVTYAILIAGHAAERKRK